MLEINRSGKKYNSLFDIYIFIICTFPILTIIGNAFVNKVAFALLLILNVLLLFQNKVRKDTFLKLLFLMIHYVFVIIVTKFPIANVNLVAYFIFFIFYTYFIIDYQKRLIEWFKYNKKIMMILVILWSVIVGISIFLPSSYHFHKSGAYYFTSFTTTTFRLAPTAVFIQIIAIILQIFHKQKYAVFYSIIPMYTYFMGSSRSYLVVGLFLFFISWYLFCDNKKVFNLSLIPIVIIMLFAIAETSIGTKIEYTLDEERYGDFWFKVSSSRSQLWTVALGSWLQTGFINKFFGNGLGFVYDLVGLWAHNDFIEILCSFGILGVLHYIYSIYYLFKNGKIDSQIPWIISISIFFAWFFNAFFNMHYTYFCAMLPFPFLVFAIKYCFSNEVIGDEKV